MAVTTLVHHPLVAQYLRFVSTTIGRDKLLRTLQYLARFLSFYLLRKGYSKTAIAPWEAVKKNFGMARKAMRLGKNVEHLKAAGVAFESTSKVPDPLTAYLTTGRQLGYFGYLTFDNIVFLSSLSLLRLQPKTAARFQRLAQKFWLAGLVFSIVNGLYSLQRLGEREKQVSASEPEGKIAGEKIVKEKSGVKKQLASDLCDFTIPSSALGVLNLDDGVVGLAGMVSSLIGLKGAWKKAAL